MNKVSKARVIALVRDVAKNITTNDIRIEVPPNDVEKKNGCWYIAVRPVAEPKSTYAFYEVLADIETELSEKHGVDVWLVPEYSPA